MALEFSIVGGYITMPKEIFIKEMLERDSVVKTLLKWRGGAGFREKHPLINEQDEAGVIKINFTGIDYVKLGDDPEQLLKKLKGRYREKIKGWVAVAGTYELMNGMFNMRIDLSSNDVNVSYL